ncbi:hypothetical protein [Kitasatospora nipponensis]|uniref:hypothetical protein n=1 Tax=Kitasatospora nipponensis TaxID=258049 RepID=UPI003CD06B68
MHKPADISNIGDRRSRAVRRHGQGPNCRSLQDLINMVSELRKREIGFASPHENLDTTT